jgi:hypothetical protein
VGWTSCALVLVGLSVAVGAGAGDTWEEECRGMLEVAGAALANEGYRLTPPVYTGQLDDGGKATLRFTLEKGKGYALVGVCGADCKDLDLRLLTAAGEEVDADLELDDSAMVEVEVAETADFMLEVLMVDCRAGPCSYGIGVFVK